MFLHQRRNAPRDGNRRAQYRVRSRPTDRIHVTVQRPSRRPSQGRCLDLSIGGTWVQFPVANDPGLEEDDACVLWIHAEPQPHSVRIACRVAAVRPAVDGEVRVGFQFLDRIELYAQLSGPYANLFNRRRHRRVPSGIDLRIPTELSWPSGSVRCSAIDVSEGGLGILLPKARAQELSRIAEVDAAFRLPSERSEIVCRAAIRARTNCGDNVLLGLEFLPDGGIRQHLSALRRCLDERFEALVNWNPGGTKKS